MYGKEQQGKALVPDNIMGNHVTPPWIWLYSIAQRGMGLILGKLTLKYSRKQIPARLGVVGLTVLLLLPPSLQSQEKKPRPQGANAPGKKSIEEKTRIHRLSTTKRAIYDAFTYINRIPEKAEEEEAPQDFAGRIFGRLANQEGRILVKLPAGMDRASYLGLKTFLRYEGKASVGNCVACHAPANFTDLKLHSMTRSGPPKPTPSLRNLKKRKIDIRKVIMGKIAASQQKRSGKSDGIAAAYAQMNISKKDVPGLVAFLGLLNDVPDKDFRDLILNVKILDTSGDIE